MEDVNGRVSVILYPTEYDNIYSEPSGLYDKGNSTLYDDHPDLSSDHEFQIPNVVSGVSHSGENDSQEDRCISATRGHVGLRKCYSNTKQTHKSKHPIKTLQLLIQKFVKNKRWLIKMFILAVLFMGYTVYFAFAVRHSVVNNKALIVLTSLVSGYIVYAWVRNNFGEIISSAICIPAGKWWDRHWHIIKWFVYVCVLLGIVIYLAVDVIQDVKQFQSLAGLALFFFIPWITCKHPRKIQWRPVIWGITLQFVIGCLVLRWRYGYNAVSFLANEINKFLGYSLEGGAQVFGDPTFFFHPFAMIVVPLVVYLGCVTAILYHWGVIQWVARKIGWWMKISLNTTAIESVSLAVNIFLSVLEVILMMKDYLPHLTVSEFHCFMVGAHSTIAGWAFAIFVLFGVSPQHLLTGAVMSAPAAVALAKLNWPETEESQFKEDKDLKLIKGDDINFIDAGIKGAWVAGKSMATIVIQVIAFVSLYALIDAIVSWFFNMVGVSLNIAAIFGYVFMPISFLMGVDWEDTQEVGRLLGLKVTANEFLSYIELGTMINSNAISDRSAAIATYAMCGFSSFGTLVIFSGVWMTVDPDRVREVSRQIPRIWMNANLACFMTACIASILYTSDIMVDETDATIGQLAQLVFGFLPDISGIRQSIEDLTGI